MLNKKEITFINSKIEQYRKWAKEEEAEARKASSKDDQEEHYLQARLNDSAADTLGLLLADLLPED